MSRGPDLLRMTERGLFCAAGGFYVDPWQPVARAIVTHAHGDHCVPGHQAVLTSEEGAPLVARRLGTRVGLEAVPYGRVVAMGDVRVSLHPAGHMRGSAQVRLERAGEVWVVTGDYKLDLDPTASSFELVPCSTLVTESTFALPVFRWPPVEDVLADILAWWQAAREEGRPAVLYGYAMGKAQRLLALLRDADGPIFTHGAVEAVAEMYRGAAVPLARTTRVIDAKRSALAGGLIVAPPASQGSAWARRFAGATSGLASGWMRVRGPRRRRALDRGFALSDHVDWPGLNDVVVATGAERVLATHGYTASAARWFRDKGLNAAELPTPFGIADEGGAVDEDEGGAVDEDEGGAADEDEGGAVKKAEGGPVGGDEAGREEVPE